MNRHAYKRTEMKQNDNIEMNGNKLKRHNTKKKENRIATAKTS